MDDRAPAIAWCIAALTTRACERCAHNSVEQNRRIYLCHPSGWEALLTLHESLAISTNCETSPTTIHPAISRLTRQSSPSPTRGKRSRGFKGYEGATRGVSDSVA